MLFNSYQFLFIFFPASIIFYRLIKYDAKKRAIILTICSLTFYASWDFRFLPLLLGSILANYWLGTKVQHAVVAGAARQANLFVALGLVLNLGALGFFKYALFAVQNVNALAGTSLVISHIVLPLGISFFTFEQIGFLVDLRRGASYSLNLLNYTVFVSFFPRLVAGPILRYSEIVPQLENEQRRLDPLADLAVGLTTFSVGLAKKALLADSIASFVPAPFDAAASGQSLDFFAAWIGALAYMCQIYFDFSGYSDMAIGAARCFGIRFPENFNSPYKSASIVEFWRRWHMTLSRFLRDYLYISLGGNRLGSARRYVNLLLTMLLGGFWHGANWTFLAWGALHGSYLIVNHGWSTMAARSRPPVSSQPSLLSCWGGHFLTFIAVLVAWVFFRAPTLRAAWAMLGAMVGTAGIELPEAILWHLQPLKPLMTALGVRVGGSGAQFVGATLWIAALLLIALVAPNTREIMDKIRSGIERPFPNPSRIATSVWAIAAGVALFTGFLSITRASTFLYWQF